MKVKEMIEYLQTLPPELPVCIYNEYTDQLIQWDKDADASQETIGNEISASQAGLPEDSKYLHLATV